MRLRRKVADRIGLPAIPRSLTGISWLCLEPNVVGCGCSWAVIFGHYGPVSIASFLTPRSIRDCLFRVTTLSEP
jgi:hypothetical protein